MMTSKRGQLIAALQSIQMHAAGLHASADLAMRLLAESDQRASQMDQLRQRRSGPPQHYGDDEQAEREIEKLFEDAGAEPPSAAQGAETPPQE